MQATPPTHPLSSSFAEPSLIPGSHRSRPRIAPIALRSPPSSVDLIYLLLSGDLGAIAPQDRTGFDDFDRI
nr:hypothetical protein CFP56_65337 [Quercus suber]